ncbi:MAG: segregation/condensation protein A [Anaerolineales bacterium]|uniref:Segregation and condensation protein A n=1 Tax=Candidatus Desulfolinea nitratireducens TaxID=2841698 RepID=A0A8J6NNA8_9CHLR|nr:segregation/condensation protein A [Candidatus Desulfolinea nitratireducens]MBL6960388.1 segregation/condensation protein A [Anaerolineales bacterium]
MSIDIVRNQSESYSVSTPVFEGPLDLLLNLIESAELDITSVSLALVTDQYLERIRALENMDADEISAFLVIAAKLVQIKSEALLPRPPVREAGEEDPGEALARQLRLYKKFKEVANWLSERGKQDLRTYLRIAAPPKVESRFEMGDVTLADLILAAETIFAREVEKAELGTVIRAPRVTIREKVSHITKILSSEKRTTFRQMVEGANSRIEVVVTFLALLELVKRYRVDAWQDALFSDIHIERMGDLLADEDFDIEFE